MVTCTMLDNNIGTNEPVPTKKPTTDLEANLGIQEKVNKNQYTFAWFTAKGQKKEKIIVIVSKREDDKNLYDFKEENGN